MPVLRSGNEFPRRKPDPVTRQGLLGTTLPRLLAARSHSFPPPCLGLRAWHLVRRLSPHRAQSGCGRGSGRVQNQVRVELQAHGCSLCYSGMKPKSVLRSRVRHLVLLPSRLCLDPSAVLSLSAEEASGPGLHHTWKLVEIWGGLWEDVMSPRTFGPGP